MRLTHPERTLKRQRTPAKTHGSARGIQDNGTQVDSIHSRVGNQLAELAIEGTVRADICSSDIAS